MQDRQDKSRCEKCRFWETFPSPNDEEKGICHCHAPTPIKSGEEDVNNCYDDASIYTLWPMTFTRDWCGEFEGTKPDYPTIEAMMLSPHIENVLKGKGIDSIEKLVNYTPRHIMALKGIGSCSFREIKYKLSEFGFYLRGSKETEKLMILEAKEAEEKADAAVKEALGIE